MKILNDIQQGSCEWHSLRKLYVTATDMNVIMSKNGSYFGKTLRSLYFDKISDEPPTPANDAMLRGSQLEPVAREFFEIQTGIKMEPKVIVKDWAMASLDGISYNNDFILEIKCPGPKDHSVAVNGMIPEHYYPQLQWQMYVTDLNKSFYYSFDGIDGVIVFVNRNDDYIENMVVKGKAFYDCLINRIPPEISDSDYLEMEDVFDWTFNVNYYKSICDEIKCLEKKKESLKEILKSVSGGFNAKGNGATLNYVTTKGRINYDNVPELKGVDLEQYREPSRQEWRLTCR